MRHSGSLLSRTARRLTLGAALLPWWSAESRAEDAAPLSVLLPVPAEMRLLAGRLAITPAFSVSVTGHNDARLRAALDRALRRWEERTGLVFARHPATDPAPAELVIECRGPGPARPTLGEDEFYALEVTTARAELHAPTVTGVLRGLETLLQLLAADTRGWFVPAVSIRDRPRFPWRGLLLDVCRHWQPMPVVKRTLDGMAAVKLNVLHLHLTEDQGFRIESRKYPRLPEHGSDGNYFTQDQIREIVAYAAERGIRVVPEFDMPGHATSWLVGHPELASQPGPYAIERRWGIFDPALDPTNDAVYELLDGFLGEMAALFPDPYLHIGGDEVNGKHWNASPHIQAFIQEHHLKDNAGLQAWFNQRVEAILTRHGRRMVGWDEILHPDLPASAVIHSWRGPNGLAAAARQGHPSLLSNGYYIDLIYPASAHYLNDPLPAGTTLTPEEQQRVLGGEATMWSEWVTPETIDSRIWPRTAAIAERLWSPREVRDADDMYRRLAVVSRRLEEIGLAIDRHVDSMLRRLAGDTATPDDLRNLRTLADLVEPVKRYRRSDQQPGVTQFTPLTGLVDCARPDSAPSRAFAGQVERYLFGSESRDAGAITTTLRAWSDAAQSIREGLATRSPRVQMLTPLWERIESAAVIGREAVDILDHAATPPAGWREEKLAALDLAGRAHDACEIPGIRSLRLLVAAATVAKEKASLPPEEWRRRVESLVTPGGPPPAEH